MQRPCTIPIFSYLLPCDQSHLFSVEGILLTLTVGHAGCLGVSFSRTDTLRSIQKPIAPTGSVFLPCCKTMPTVLPPAVVLVIGSSGFTGTWITRALLEAGYTVDGTVRSWDKAQYLTNLLKEYGDRFRPVIVEDISKVLTIILLHRRVLILKSIDSLVHLTRS